MLDKSRALRLEIHEKRATAERLLNDADRLGPKFIRQFVEEANKEFTGQWIRTFDMECEQAVLHHCTRVSLALITLSGSENDYNVFTDKVLLSFDVSGAFDKATGTWSWFKPGHAVTLRYPVSELIRAEIVPFDTIVKECNYTGENPIGE